jgi:hypothetical protein
LLCTTNGLTLSSKNNILLTPDRRGSVDALVRRETSKSVEINLRGDRVYIGSGLMNDDNAMSGLY